MTYDPRTYWPERYRRQGPLYVAQGGRADSYREQLEAITPYLDHLPESGTVLDYGCGPGRWRGPLKVRGLTYVGVDIIPGLGTEPMAEALVSERFDCAVCIWVLQHITDWADYFESVTAIHHSLKPGGRLLVVDALPDPDAETYPHMAPRGPAGLRDVCEWRRSAVVGAWNGSWAGWLDR